MVGFAEDGTQALQMGDHYSVLGIAQNAPAEVVRAAYRVLAQKYHPDRQKSHPDRNSDATRMLQDINVAYEVLSDPLKRAAYDDELASRRENRDDEGRARREGSSSVHPGMQETSEREGGRHQERPETESAEVCVAAWEHRNTEYRLLRQRGIVIEHREWVEHAERIKYDARLFVGIGRYVGTDTTAKQTVWLRLSGSDQQLEMERDLLPVATGQHVTLVSIESQRNGYGQRYPLILENHATQRYHSISRLHTVTSDFLEGESAAFGGKVFLVQLLLGAALSCHVRHWHVGGLPRILLYGLAIVVVGWVIAVGRSMIREGALGKTVRFHLAEVGLRAD